MTILNLLRKQLESCKLKNWIRFNISLAEEKMAQKQMKRDETQRLLMSVFLTAKDMQILKSKSLIYDR